MFSYEPLIGKYLYHYTSHDTALNHILPKLQLKFGLLQETNDPRESKHWTFTYTGMPEDIKAYMVLGYNKFINEEIKKNVKVICFSQDDNEKYNAGCSRTCRGYAHPRMWAQYAVKHSGICLVFNKNIMLYNAKMTLNYRIAYFNEVNYLSR